MYDGDSPSRSCAHYLFRRVLGVASRLIVFVLLFRRNFMQRDERGLLCEITQVTTKFTL